MLKQDLKQPDNRNLEGCHLLLPKSHEPLVQKIIGKRYPWRSYSDNSPKEVEKQISQTIQQLKPEIIIQIGRNNTRNITPSIPSIKITPGLASPTLYDLVHIHNNSTKEIDIQRNLHEQEIILPSILTENIIKIKGTPLHHKSANKIYQQHHSSILVVIDLTKPDKALIDKIKNEIKAKTNKNKDLWFALYPKSNTDLKNIKTIKFIKNLTTTKNNIHWAGKLKNPNQYLVLLSKFKKVITNNYQCIADSVILETPVTALNENHKIPILTDILSKNHIPRSLAFSPIYFRHLITKTLAPPPGPLNSNHYLHLISSDPSLRGSSITQAWSDLALEKLDIFERKLRKLFRDPKQFFLDSKHSNHTVILTVIYAFTRKTKPTKIPPPREY